MLIRKHKHRSPGYEVASTQSHNLVPRACDPREGTRGSGIIRCRKPRILAKIELRIPFQRPIRFLPETDYPRASRSFPRIAGSGNEIANLILVPLGRTRVRRALGTRMHPICERACISGMHTVVTRLEMI